MWASVGRSRQQKAWFRKEVKRWRDARVHWNLKEGYLEEEARTLLYYWSAELPQARPSLCNLSVVCQNVFEPIPEVDLILPSSLQILHGHKDNSQHLAIHEHTPEVHRYSSSQKFSVFVTAFCSAHRIAQVLLVLFFSCAIPFQELLKLLLQVASYLPSSCPFPSRWEPPSISYCPYSTWPLREVARHGLSRTQI